MLGVTNNCLLGGEIASEAVRRAKWPGAFSTWDALLGPAEPLGRPPSHVVAGCGRFGCAAGIPMAGLTEL